MSYQHLLSDQTALFAPPALRRITLEVAKVGGINLGQGVCQLPVPSEVLEAAAKAATDGHNRYTNPRGTDNLRQALAQKLAHFNKIKADPHTEIVATHGATGAFEGICGVLLNPGDEAVIFEPSYPYHITALRRYQAKIKTLTLQAPDWKLEPDALKAAISPKTKFVLINTPGNPTGKVWTREELVMVAEAIKDTDALVVTDETYEYMTFDGRKHLSPAAVPELAGKVITVGSYSKTFSITGWRIGYLVAPATISEKLTAFLDAVYVCPPAPFQEAVAAGIQTFDNGWYTALCAKYQAKRDHFAAGLLALGLEPLVPEGAYYMLVGYQNLCGAIDSTTFVDRMIQTAKVGAVPSEDFVSNPASAHWMRFCLALPDERLQSALDQLAGLQSLAL